MKPLIVVPWRPAAEDRIRAWAYLRPYYEDLGWPIVEADSGDEPFNRANSQNLGAASQDWDAVLILDADCYVPLHAIREGVEIAIREGCVVLPHDRYLPMNVYETEAVYAGGPIPSIVAGAMPASHVGARGGLHIISRAAWDAIGGYDPVRPRAQDTRLLQACEALHIKVLRLRANLVHFYHSRPDRENEKALNERGIAAFIPDLYKNTTPIGTKRWMDARNKWEAAGRPV